MLFHANVNHRIRMQTDKAYREQFKAGLNRMMEQAIKERTGRDIRFTP
jgi:hypothetical protein